MLYAPSGSNHEKRERLRVETHERIYIDLFGKYIFYEGMDHI